MMISGCDKPSIFLLRHRIKSPPAARSFIPFQWLACFGYRPTLNFWVSIKAIYTQVLFLLLRRRASDGQAKIMMTDGRRHSEQVDWYKLTIFIINMEIIIQFNQIAEPARSQCPPRLGLPLTFSFSLSSAPEKTKRGSSKWIRRHYLIRIVVITLCDFNTPTSCDSFDATTGGSMWKTHTWSVTN